LDTKWSRIIFGFLDALVYSVYRTDFPDKPNFSCKTKPLSTGMSSLEDKISYGQIDSRIINTYASGYVEENVFGAKPETGPFPELKIIFSLLAL
jgi:hypothetical protein